MVHTRGEKAIETRSQVLAKFLMTLLAENIMQRLRKGANLVSGILSNSNVRLSEKELCVNRYGKVLIL